jgi:hypothetical protein
LVLLVDQAYGFVAVAGPQEERLEDHVRVIDLHQGIEVATVVRSESGSDQLQVLLRHRAPSISAKYLAGTTEGRGLDIGKRSRDVLAGVPFPKQRADPMSACIGR